ncbi:MAG: ribonuclease HI family protein [Candidatus Dependentiae bacterium]
MKQLHIFDTSDSETSSHNSVLSHHYTLYVDGASRNNPGDAGAGMYIEKDGQSLEKRGFYLGVRTNNQAEYLALLVGIYYTKKHMLPQDTLSIISDSELLVRQVKGLYKVKQPELQQLFAAVKKTLQPIRYTISHVLREKNKQADAMANYGIDKKIMPPQEFLNVLKNYDINW